LYFRKGLTQSRQGAKIKKFFKKEKRVKSGFKSLDYARWHVAITKHLVEKVDFKVPDYSRGQGASRFESGAYTIVCEHFEPACNAAIGD
jgi:hypothetical protein